MSSNVFALKSSEISDPFLEIDTKIQTLSREIYSSGGAQCEFLSGNKFTQYYNRGMNGFSSLGMDLNEMFFSTCYSKTIQRIDADIQRKVLTPFVTSGVACQKFSAIQEDIDTLIQLRWALRPTVIDLPKSISQKYCQEDTRSNSLGQTAATWKKLKKKIEEISSFFDEDTRSVQEKQHDAEQEKKKRDLRKKRIQEQARRRVQSFVNEFIRSSIIAPLYAERSHINQNLRSLPNANSRFVSTTPVSVSEMFFPPKDAQGNSLWSPVFADSIRTKITNMYQEKKYIDKNITQFNDFILHEKVFTDTLNTLRKNLQDELEKQESSREFSEAYSESIINSLRPFHKTLNDAESFMTEKTKLLEKTLNRQNISVY